MSFRIGQKVIRISGPMGIPYSVARSYWGDFTYPQIGDVVTIRTINEWPDVTLLTFYEHDNSGLQKLHGDRWEPGFGAEHFRPIVSRETDISIFKKLLQPHTRKTQKELQ